MLGRDFDQGSMHVLGHSLGVSADIEVSAILQPAPQLCPFFLHPMLDVNFVGLIAGESSRELVQVTRLLRVGEFIGIEKVGLGVLVAKEEPVATRMAVTSAVLEKSAKRGDPCPRADHDDIPIRCGEVKVSGGLDINGDGGGARKIGQVARGEASFCPPMRFVLYQSDGEVNFAGAMVGRRGDGVEPGGDLVEQIWNF